MDQQQAQQIQENIQFYIRMRRLLWIFKRTLIDNTRAIYHLISQSIMTGDSPTTTTTTKRNRFDKIIKLSTWTVQIKSPQLCQQLQRYNVFFLSGTLGGCKLCKWYTNAMGTTYDLNKNVAFSKSTFMVDNMTRPLLAVRATNCIRQITFSAGWDKWFMYHVAIELNCNDTNAYEFNLHSCRVFFSLSILILFELLIWMCVVLRRIHSFSRGMKNCLYE